MSADTSSKLNAATAFPSRLRLPQPASHAAGTKLVAKPIDYRTPWGARWRRPDFGPPRLSPERQSNRAADPDPGIVLLVLLRRYVWIGA
jgi:hypothetical protein